jgi:NADPH:quinone reductase-like Zn-dependent oxidoreductase
MPKRLAITAPYKVELLDYEEPDLGRNEVRVQTAFASGKHGTTTGLMAGNAFNGWAFDHAAGMFRKTDAEPADDGSEFAVMTSGTAGVGVVTAVGREVSRWKVGDTVFGHMDVRETNTCAEDGLWALGDIAPETAVCFEPAFVSIHCVRESNVRWGDTVAVIGLGAIGLIAVEMCRAAGAEKIFAIDLLENRRRWCLENGADHAFDPRDVDVAEKIRELNDGRGVDVAMEITGAYPALQLATRAVATSGTVVSAGFYTREAKGDLHLGRDWHHKRLKMIVPTGCAWGYEPRDYPLWDLQRSADAIVKMMRRKNLVLKNLIDPVIGFDRDQAQAVFTAMREDPGRLMKYGVHF